MKNGPELMGWTHIPEYVYAWWKDSHPYWNAVAWHHLQTGEYITWGRHGEPNVFAKMKGKAHIHTVAYHPIDASILPILDAWIRFFEVWEPQVERDYL